MPPPQGTSQRGSLRPATATGEVPAGGGDSSIQKMALQVSLKLFRCLSYTWERDPHQEGTCQGSFSVTSRPESRPFHLYPLGELEGWQTCYHGLFHGYFWLSIVFLHCSRWGFPFGGWSLSLSLGTFFRLEAIKLFCLRKSGFELLLSPSEPGMSARQGGSPRAVEAGASATMRCYPSP